MHVSIFGDGPNVLLIHGGIHNGTTTWQDQLVLAGQFRLIIPDRPGYPPNPPIEREDFEADARLIADMVEPNTHMVGYSYGGVIALFAAALCPDRVASLTVIEPPAFGLARGVSAADDLMRGLEEHWHSGIREPREFLVGFVHLVAGRDIELPPDPLPPDLEQGVQTLMGERLPWDKNPPLDELSQTTFPKLVLSGGHSTAFDAVCEVISMRLDADYKILAGNGHGVPGLVPTVNEVLMRFFKDA
jgi:pimeloyl-ACP methyl ester carboxylesterase